MTSIIHTNPGEPHFNIFTDFPETIYPKESVRLKNPEVIPTDFLKQCYLLLHDGHVVARASVYDNPFLKYNEEHVFTIGNYECERNAAYALELLWHIIGLINSFGGKYVLGPMNGSTWESYRFGSSDDQPLFFTEPVHHSYYLEQFVQAGFDPIAHYYSNIDRNMQCNNAVILQRQKELNAAGVTIRPIDLLNFEAEVEKIYDFNAIAFKTNFLYTPISKESFMRKYLQSKKYIDPRLTLIAEDVNQNVIGYYFCVRDFLNLDSKSLIVKTLARHPDPAWRGLGHVIGNIVYRNAMELGYTSAIHSFVYQRGTSTKLSENFSGVRYKNYVLYGRSIS